MANRELSKQWFETGDKPTQTQFQLLLDYLFFKDEGIAIGNVAGLLDALLLKADAATVTTILERVAPDLVNASANFSYSLKNGLSLRKIGFLLTSPMQIKIGTTNGGNEIMELIQIGSGYEELSNPKAYADGADKLIYVSGITQACKVIFWKE